MRRATASLGLVVALAAIGFETAQQASAIPDCGDGPMTPEIAQCLHDGAVSAPAEDKQATVYAYKHGDDVCEFFRQGGVNIDALTQAKTYLTGTIGISSTRASDVVTSSVLWNCPEYGMAVGNIN